jgi:hypothetical protein
MILKNKNFHRTMPRHPIYAAVDVTMKQLVNRFFAVDPESEDARQMLEEARACIM